MVQWIVNLNNIQVNHNNSRVRTNVVSNIMKSKKRKKYHQENPAGNEEFLNAEPRILDLLGFLRRIRFQVCAMPLEVDI